MTSSCRKLSRRLARISSSPPSGIACCALMNKFSSACLKYLESSSAPGSCASTCVRIWMP
jgi:hypothetical protein